MDWDTAGLDGSNTIKVVADPDDSGQKCIAIVEDGGNVATSLYALLKADRAGVAFRNRMRSTDHHWYMTWFEGATDQRVTILRDDDDNHMEWYDGDSYEQFNPVEIFYALTWYIIDNQIMDTGEDYFHWLQDGVDNTGGFRSTPDVGVDRLRFTPFK